MLLLCALFGVLLNSAEAKKPAPKRPVTTKKAKQKTVKKKTIVRRQAAKRTTPKTIPSLVSSAPSPQLQACPPQQEGPCPNCADQALAIANSFTGLRYRKGGTDPKLGFDCSGFVQYVFANSCDLHLPRSASQQFAIGQEVNREDLQPGDLLFFRSRQGWHVGIYSGDGKFIHSPNRKQSIRQSALATPFWNQTYKGARRLNVSPPPSTETESLPSNEVK